MNMLLEIGSGVVAGGVALVVVIIVVVVVVALKGKGAAPTQPATPPQAATPPQPVAPAQPAAPSRPPAQAAPAAPAAAPRPEPVAIAPSPPTAEMLRPATDGVPALAASETGMTPMLAEPEMGLDAMGEDLPRIGTGESPALSDAPARYRTAAAQALKQAIDTMACPKCGAPTFVGMETPQEVGADGMAMFKLEGRCGACGHKTQVIDMRVG